MEVVWSEFSQNTLKDIFNYYKKNASKTIAIKIKNQILLSTKHLVHNHEVRQIEPLLEKLNENHRHIVTRNHILITDVFDARQNPLKMNQLR